MFNKKLLFTALVAVAGYLGYKRVQADKAEQDLWAEATDPVAPRERQ
ncbi:MAG TPA: DLW-39 family protein [Jiangellaceae bacterium]